MAGIQRSTRFAWQTHGRVTSQGLKPHDDLLAEFPYLGPPNLYPVGVTASPRREGNPDRMSVPASTFQMLSTIC